MVVAFHTLDAAADDDAEDARGVENEVAVVVVDDDDGDADGELASVRTRVEVDLARLFPA
jgi:hypothetical protein